MTDFHGVESAKNIRNETKGLGKKLQRQAQGKIAIAWLARGPESRAGARSPQAVSTAAFSDGSNLPRGPLLHPGATHAVTQADPSCRAGQASVSARWRWKLGSSNHPGHAGKIARVGSSTGSCDATSSAEGFRYQREEQRGRGRQSGSR